MTSDDPIREHAYEVAEEALRDPRKRWHDSLLTPEEVARIVVDALWPMIEDARAVAQLNGENLLDAEDDLAEERELADELARSLSLAVEAPDMMRGPKTHAVALAALAKWREARG